MQVYGDVHKGARLVSGGVDPYINIPNRMAGPLKLKSTPPPENEFLIPLQN